MHLHNSMQAKLNAFYFSTIQLMSKFLHFNENLIWCNGMSKKRELQALRASVTLTKQSALHAYTSFLILCSPLQWPNHIFMPFKKCMRIELIWKVHSI